MLSLEAMMPGNDLGGSDDLDYTPTECQFCGQDRDPQDFCRNCLRELHRDDDWQRPEEPWWPDEDCDSDQDS
jgi:predicted amidophosphoribosyltransferase